MAYAGKSAAARATAAAKVLADSVVADSVEAAKAAEAKAASVKAAKAAAKLGAGVGRGVGSARAVVSAPTVISVLAPGVPDLDTLVAIGNVHGPYGLKGWVWIMSKTEPIANIFGYGPWFIEHAGVIKPAKLIESRAQGKGLVAQLDCSPTRDTAEALHGAVIWVPKSVLPALEEDEYYWSELIDMQVITEQSQLLGAVYAMMETGANDVIVVRACEGSIDGEERLLPWLPGRVVRFVDRVQKRITVDWDPDF